MSRHSRSGWKSFNLSVAALSLTLGSVAPVQATSILMVGADDGPTFGGDAGTYAILAAEYGEAAALGDDGVFYMRGDASVPEDADLVDVVFVSSTLGSGTVRDKFEDTAAGVLNHEQALMPDDQTGDFFMVSAAQTLPGVSQLTIVDPDHPLAAGLEDVIDVFTSAQTMSVGIAATPTDLAPDAFVIAEVTGSSTLKGIYAIEEGGRLRGDGSPGSPEEAPGRRVMFFLEDQGGNFLTVEGEELLIAAMDWLATGTTCARPARSITRSLEPALHEPGQTIRVTLAVTGVAGQATSRRRFPITSRSPTRAAEPSIRTGSPSPPRRTASSPTRSGRRPASARPPSPASRVEPRATTCAGLAPAGRASSGV